MRRMGPIPGFRDGGPVMTSGSDKLVGTSEPMNIQIQNSGSEKEVVEASTARDAKGIIINVILEDVAKNGPVARGMQNTFGLKRGARK